MKPLTCKKIHKMYTFSEGSNGYTPLRGFRTIGQVKSMVSFVLNCLGTK